MGEIIKTFEDGTKIEFDRGGIDTWCVYVTPPGGNRTAPKDEDYFTQLKLYADKYGAERIYDYYLHVYDLSTNEVEQDVLSEISEMSLEYEDEDSLDMDVLFSILYAAMVAEENRRNTRLGKRIKRLGVYSLLVEDQPVAYATTFMKGMGWRDIDYLCNQRGF